MLFLAWVAIQLVLFVATALLTPKPHFEDATPEDPRGPRTNEGEVLSVVFGTVKIAANISYFGNVRAREEQEHVKTGIFSSKNVTIGYSYDAAFQAILCHGPIDELVDVVFDVNKSLAAFDAGPEVFGPIDADGDGTLESYGVVSGGVSGGRTNPLIIPANASRVNDASPIDGLTFGTNTNANGIFGGYKQGGGIAGKFTFYWGVPGQEVSPVMVAALSVNQYNMRYEGVCHVVFGEALPPNGAGFRALNQFYYGERSVLPALEFIVRRCPSALGLSLAQTNLSGGANPAEMIYDVLTNAVWGLGMPVNQIDIPSFVAAGTTLATEGFGLSLSINDGQAADSVITEICRYIDGQVQQHPVTGLIEMTLNRNDYVVGALPVLNEGNVQSAQYTRPSWTSLKNEVRVIYTQRRGVFFKQVPTQPIQDIAQQRNFAEVNATTVEFPACTDPILANRIGVRTLRLIATPLGKIRITVDRTAADFRVGRPFVFSWADYGITAAVYRVGAVDYGTMSDGKIVVDAVQDVFSLEQPLYNVPVDPASVDPTLSSRRLLEVDAQPSENATTGFLDLVIVAGTGLVSYVEFQSQSGNRTPGPWHRSESNTGFRASVDKHSTLQSNIQWRVMGPLKDGTTGAIASGAVSFDVQAAPTTPDVSFVPGTLAGRLSALIYTDSDTTTIKYAVSKTGQPSLATVRAASPAVLSAGQTLVNLIDVITLATGEEAYISVLAYDAAGNESLIGTVNETSTVIYPEMRATPTENGTVGTLVLTPVDPQGRLTRVQMASVLGNLSPVFADVAPIGGTYTATVSLIEKQPSRIEYRAYSMVGGVEQVVEERGVRFAVGSLPLPPEVSYQIDADGTLTVIARGDSDTDMSQFLVTLDAPPTLAAIDAATGPDNSFIGRTTTFVYTVGGVVRKLVPGQKFYLGVRSYNSLLPGALGAKGSQLVIQTDQWVGPSDARATVSIGTVGVDSRSLTFGNIVLGPLTSRVEVFVREYRADPGAIVSVASIGHRAPGTPLLANGSIIVAVANPSNWLLVTFVAYDALNRIGAGQVTGLAVAGGTVTVKFQASASAAVAPAAPADLGLTAPNTNSVSLAITMPGSNLPASLRIYRDGVALPDIARSAVAGAVQTFIDVGRTPGSAISYQVYGVSAAGVLSTTGSPVRSITLGASVLPTPTLGAGAFSQAQGGIPITITPGAGSPGGETYQLEHATELVDGTTGNPLGYGAWGNAESTTALSFLHAHGAGAQVKHDKLRVTASKTGYTNSLASAEVIVNIPKWTGTINGG